VLAISLLSSFAGQHDLLESPDRPSETYRQEFEVLGSWETRSGHPSGRVQLWLEAQDSHLLLCAHEYRGALEAGDLDELWDQVDSWISSEFTVTLLPPGTK